MKNILPTIHLNGTPKNKLLDDYYQIAIAIEKSGKSSEVILDLWSAITSKGITNRKDYERLVERVGKGKLQRSKKKGQTRLTQAQADEQAKQSLSATIVGDKTKIPGSFHVKLY